VRQPRAAGLSARTQPLTQLRPAPHRAAIADNRARFSAPPVGPVGSLLRLSDPQWGVALEEAMGPSLAGFLVATPADAQLLQQLAKSKGIHNQSATAMKGLAAASVYNIPAAKLPDASLMTMMQVLSSDTPAVMNALIDSAHIEAVVLCERPQEAAAVAFSRTPNVRDVYTPDGTKRNCSANGEGTWARQRTGSARIGADMSAQLAVAERQLGELAARRAQAEARKRAAVDVLQRADEEARRMTQRVRATANAMNAAKADLEDAHRAAAAAASAGAADAAADVDAFEDQLRELEEEDAGLAATQAEARAALDVAAAAAGTARAAASEKEAAARGAAAEAMQLQGELTAAIDALAKLQNEVAHYTKVRNDIAAAVEKHEADAAAARAAAAAEAAKAAQYCSREEAMAVPLPRGEGDESGVERLGALLAQVETRIRREEARAKRPYEEVAEDLAEVTRDAKRLKAALGNAEEPARRMREGYAVRYSLLRRTARELARNVSNCFNIHMAKRGHTGLLRVDYAVGELHIELQLANTTGANGASVTCKDLKQLSGGERSYTTLSFTLSLNEQSDSPFCAMDEWDVFMDAVARKVSLDKMLEYAQDNKHKQFILITPNDISAVKPSEFVSIQKLKAPRSAT
jgi:chromosome segregation ATPase